MHDDAAWLHALVSRLTDHHEAPQARPWGVGDAPREYIDTMLRAIVGIEIPVAGFTGKWKTSQNRNAADREGVARGLAAAGTDGRVRRWARWCGPAERDHPCPAVQGRTRLARMDTTLPPLIGPEPAALLARRVSIIVGSRDAALRPHVMRAVGCRVADDRRRLTVFLPRASSRWVLDDIAANGQIAVVFSEPTTHRTVQFKGVDATVAPLAPGDEAIVARYLANFTDEIAEIGFSADVAQSILGHAPGDLAAVDFTPLAGFEQTPGPTAGQALAPQPR